MLVFLIILALIMYGSFLFYASICIQVGFEKTKECSVITHHASTAPISLFEEAIRILNGDIHGVEMQRGLLFLALLYDLV